ncbi:MAG: hypothetical protein RIC55_26140 [Pirellulaceae bacterium]
MSVVLRVLLYAVGAVFGACAGAVIGMAACLILRDGLQLEMPLSRITIIASCLALVGLVLNVLYEHWSISSKDLSPSRKPSTETKPDASPK